MSPTMGQTLRKLVQLALAGLLLAGGWWGYGQLTAPDDTPRAGGGGGGRAMMGGRAGNASMNLTAPVVQTVAADFSARQPALQLFGQTRFGRSWELSSELTARVQQIHVDEGDRVSAGTLLITLDARELERNLARVEADINEMEARLRRERLQGESDQASLLLEEELLSLNEQALRRVEDLAQRNLASASDVESARRNVITQQQALQSRRLAVTGLEDTLAQLEAQLQSLRQEAEDLTEDLELTRIVAPESGLVETIQIQPGARVSAGSQLLSLQSTDSFQVRATLPASRAGLLDREAPLSGHMRWQDEDTELVLHNWGIRNEDGGIPVTFNVVNPRPPLIAGQFSTLTILLPAVDNVLALPAGAIYGNNRIYTIDNDNRLRGHTATIVGQDPDRPGEGFLISANGVPPGADVLTTRLQRPETGLRIQRLGSRNGTSAVPTENEE